METEDQTRNGLAQKIVAMREDAPSAGQVDLLMESLEALAESDADAACCLMMDLWPIASDVFMHHVCDAIALWIIDHRSPAVVLKLTRLSATDLDPEMRQYWRGLLANP